ncbi:hypothetical protein GCM10020331_087980 [Ectobacillus funiculus]
MFMSKSAPNGPAAIKDVKLPDNVYGAVKDMIPYFDEGKNSTGT